MNDYEDLCWALCLTRCKGWRGLLTRSNSFSTRFQQKKTEKYEKSSSTPGFKSEEFSREHLSEFSDIETRQEFLFSLLRK